MINPRAPSPLSDNLFGEFNSLVQSLINNLREEINIYSELYQLIQDEREIIRLPSLEALGTSNSKKEGCLLKAQTCKDHTEEISKSITKLLRPGYAGEMNLSLISDYAESSLRQQLLDYRERLSSLINAVRNCSDQNKYLLQSSMAYTRSSLMFIQKSISAPINYMSTGQLTVATPNGQILNQKG
jgi:flagellar biosynthesis/type III secretory pathway chaperone